MSENQIGSDRNGDRMPKRGYCNIVDVVTPPGNIPILPQDTQTPSAEFMSSLPILANSMALPSETIGKITQLLNDDPIVQSVEAGDDSVSFLHVLKLEVAKETAFINRLKYNPALTVDEVAELSQKHLSGLVKLATLEKDILKNCQTTVDLRQEKFQRVFQFWLETLKEVVEAILLPEQVDLLFNKLEVALTGWEDKASILMLQQIKQNTPTGEFP